MQISIHTGPVISGVVGDSKPQFTLIGEAVTKTIRLCQVAEPLKVTCSKETLRYLQLYTNNLQFKRTFVEMIDFGKEAIFEVSVMRGKSRSNMMKGDNIHDQEDIIKNDGANDEENFALGEGLAQRKNISEIGLIENNDEQDLNLSFRSEKSNYESDNEMKNHRQYEEQYDYENESNKSGLIDDGTMNLFGFNDDLNLDDRIIILNATDNNMYNVVERPKYLLQFDQKDLEQEFLFSISK